MYFKMYELWHDPGNFETTSIILHLALHTTCIMREWRAWWFLNLVSVDSHMSALYCSLDRWKASNGPEFKYDLYWILVYILLCLFVCFVILAYSDISKAEHFFLKSNLNYIHLYPSFYMQLGCPRGIESRIWYILSERAHFNIYSFIVYCVSNRFCSQIN